MAMASGAVTCHIGKRCDLPYWEARGDMLYCVETRGDLPYWEALWPAILGSAVTCYVGKRGDLPYWEAL